MTTNTRRNIGAPPRSDIEFDQGWIGSFEPESWLGLRSSRVTGLGRSSPAPRPAPEGSSIVARFVAGLVGALVRIR